MEKLTQSLEQLYEAVKRLVNQKTFPRTPLSRPRIFFLTPSIMWPLITTSGDPSWYEAIDLSAIEVFRLDKEEKRAALAQAIMEEVRCRPRYSVENTTKKIKAAIAWCEKKRKARQKKAKEILKREKKYVELLDAEAVLYKLEK